MPRPRRSKEDKAKYDKERKAIQRREMRFTKPFKLFIQRKYPVQYDEFIKFYILMESTSPSKKDLTKTEMFRKFLRDYPTQETNYPIITSMIQATSTEPSV